MYEAPLPPQKIRILGAGRFGRLAAERLLRRYPDASFLVVDSREEKLREVQSKCNLPVRNEDAVASLEKDPVSDDAWIIPAVPVHVAFLWLLDELRRTGECIAMPVPDTVDAQVPNPYRVPDGTVYASFATFICPDACSEPDEICTHTGAPRPGNLFEALSRIDIPNFHVAVVRSHQLAPGVGGYTGGHIKAVLNAILKAEGNYLIATSCRCHGVINALNWRRRTASFE
jgi:hypothetical protein